MKKSDKLDNKLRVPVSTAFKLDMYERLERLREKGWKISNIFILGIETAEKKK